MKTVVRIGELLVMNLLVLFVAIMQTLTQASLILRVNLALLILLPLVHRVSANLDIEKSAICALKWTPVTTGICG